MHRPVVGELRDAQLLGESREKRLQLGPIGEVLEHLVRRAICQPALLVRVPRGIAAANHGAASLHIPIVHQHHDRSDTQSTMEAADAASRG
jgi:hypothetical protein